MLHAASFAFALLAQTPSIVTNGIYHDANGLKLELVGIANVADRQSPAIDSQGRSLPAQGRKEFELYAQKKLATRPWTKRIDKGRVVLLAVFKVSGPKEVRVGIHPLGPFRPHRQFYSSPDPETGRLSHCIAFEFTAPKSEKQVSVPLQIPSGAYQQIVTFTPKGESEDRNFEFEVQSGTQNAIHATKEKTTTIKIDAYRGVIWAPNAYKGFDFELTVSDARPKPTKPSNDLSMDLGGAHEVGEENGRLKLEFFGHFQNRGAKDRKLILLGRPKKFVTFRMVRPS